MTRAETKERNRRALLDAAREIVARDGYRARLDEISERAGLTTGAIYSLFGSKDGLLIALVTDYFGPHQEELARALAPEPGLAQAAAAFARYHWRLCADPGAGADLAFETSLYDMAMRDPGLRTRLAEAEAEHERRLATLFAGRTIGPPNSTISGTIPGPVSSTRDGSGDGDGARGGAGDGAGNGAERGVEDRAVVSERQARRLARALKALIGGLAQAVILGLPDADTEQYFADAARALAFPAILGPH